MQIRLFIETSTHSKFFIIRELLKTDYEQLFLRDLLIKNGILKLGGFDLTCKSVVNQTNFKWKAGKSPYLSPNVLKGNYDFNSDVWSSGCVLFEMIKGERLFDNLKETKKTLRKRIENKEINRVFEK
jgi:serine/threonine protein kinase